MFEYLIARCVVDVETGCWMWTRGLNDRGRAVMQDPTTRRPNRTARVSYRTFSGEIPQGLHVLHHCDNPGCINPDHLFLGTHVDNMADKKAKGRAPNTTEAIKGESNWNARLTEEKVREIRRDPRIGRKIAADYGVSDVMIGKIKRRVKWAHVK